MYVSHIVGLGIAGTDPEAGQPAEGRVIEGNPQFRTWNIEEAGNGLFAGVCADVAGALERAGESLRVVHVHLTAEGAHLIGALRLAGAKVERGGEGRAHDASKSTSLRESARRGRRAVRSLA